MNQTATNGTRPFAVITGASTGIGLELAHQFAQNGFDILIASASEEILEAQDELEAYGTDVECIEVDLATYNGVELLTKAIKSYNRPVDALAINAGVGVGGDFTETSLKEEISMINLNAISAVHLTKNLLPDMYENRSGRIMYTSSIASVMPSPFEAVYAATKAFITSFAEGIRNEAKDHGVTVTILMPGANNTKVGSEGKYDNEPSEVARQGFEAMMNGEERVFAASFKMKIQGWASKVLPEKFKASYHRKLSEPGSNVVS